MKFKVGDKAKVKNIKELKKINRKACEEFFDWANKIVTIKEVYGDGDYTVEETANFWFSDNDLLFVDFTLNDLEFGDIVTLGNDERYVFASGRLYGEFEHNFMDSETIEGKYTNDLRFKYYSVRNETGLYNIIKVERDGNVIWQHEEPEVKEMTVEEISKALGYEVKIVKEKK